MKDTIIAVIWSVLALVLGLGVILVLAFLYERATRNRLSSDSGRQTEYRIIGGCYVEVDGQMIPKENWREL